MKIISKWIFFIPLIMSMQWETFLESLEPVVEDELDQALRFLEQGMNQNENELPTHLPSFDDEIEKMLTREELDPFKDFQEINENTQEEDRSLLKVKLKIPKKVRGEFKKKKAAALANAKKASPLPKLK